MTPFKNYEREYLQEEFHQTDFSRTDLKNKVFAECNFVDCDFYKADIRTTCFYRCTFGRCNWLEVLYNQSTDFYESTFFDGFVLGDTKPQEQRQQAREIFNARLKNLPEPEIKKEIKPIIKKTPQTCLYGSDEPAEVEIKTCCGGRERKEEKYFCSYRSKSILAVVCRICPDFTTKAPCQHRGGLVERCTCGADMYMCNILKIPVRTFKRPGHNDIACNPEDCAKYSTPE